MHNITIVPHTVNDEAINGESKYVHINDATFVVSLYDSEIQELINNNYQGSKPEVNYPALIEAEYKILHKDAKPPYRKRPTDLAYDIFTAEAGIIPSWGSSIIKTGIAIAVKRGYYYTVEGRSGLGVNDNLIPFRGQIDATYVGELQVKMYNLSDKDYNYKKNERIAQIAYHQQIDAIHKEVQEFSEEYNRRGVAGFGSSGK